MKTSPENQNEAMPPARVSGRKKVWSMFDPFTEPLLRMDEAGKSLAEMLAWLEPQGIVTSVANLSAFLIRRRANQQLDGERNLVEAVQQWFAENPNPKLEAVIERFKLLALNLSMQKEAVPEVLRLADRLAGTAIRADYRTRKLVMEEAKHAEWVKCERTRGLEYCLILAKEHPAVADMFRSTFAALKKCQEEARK